MANFEDLILRDTRAAQPAAGVEGRLYYVTDEAVLERDSGTAWEDASTGSGAIDAGVVTYTPAVATDWDSDADPGDVDNALDQLAERVDDLENAGSGGFDYILIQDQKAQNTAAQTITSGDWRTHELTTEVSDVGGHATLASNQITLAVGTYTIRAWCYFYGTVTSQARLYNVTDNVLIALGASVYARSSASTQHTIPSFVDGYLTIAAPKVIELQVRVNTSNVAGQPANYDTEVYASVELLKIA